MASPAPLKVLIESKEPVVEDSKISQSSGDEPGVLNALTRLMAAELAPKIRVNAVLPGAIETDALRTWLGAMDPALRETMIRNTPMRRNGVADDIADAVLYLCSPASSFVTGELLKVDGMAADDMLPHQVPDL